MTGSSWVFDVADGDDSGAPGNGSPDDIVVGRRRGRRRAVIVLIVVAVTLSAITVVGGVRPWKRGDDAPVTAVRAFLGSEPLPRAAGGGELALGELWELHAGAGTPLPVAPVVDDDDPLTVISEGSAQWSVAAVEGGPVMWLGEVPLFEVVVSEGASGAEVDVEASFLRARSRTLGFDGDAVVVSRAATPEDAAEAYIRALLGGDGAALTSMIAPDPTSPMLDHPSALGWLVAPETRFTVTSVDLSPLPPEVDGSPRLRLDRLTAVPAGADPLEVDAFNGLALLGRPVPAELSVVQDDSGWRVDHAATEAGAWAAAVAAGDSGAGRLKELLTRWGVVAIGDPGPLIPVRGGGRPLSGAMPAPGTGTDPAPEAPAESDGGGSTPPPPDLQALLPNRPPGSLELRDWSGAFDAARLTQSGLVGSVEALTDHGFVSAVGTSWTTADGGVLVLVLRYDAPSTALSEFDFFHGPAAVPGLPSTVVAAANALLAVLP